MKHFVSYLSICLLQVALIPSTSSAENGIPDSQTIISLLPKKSLNESKLGLNSFVNDGRFGSIRTQFLEAKNVLGIKHFRCLFAWNDQIQASPEAAANFSFYDNIVRYLPRNTDALIILTGLPSWMSQEENWIDGDPRKTFVELWVKKVVQRYKSKGRVVGFQIWNEPNMQSNPDNVTLDIVETPANYVSLLSQAYLAAKSIAPRKKVVAAATTAINQNFPETIDYNEAMLEAGVENYLDMYALHYYGSHLENVYRSGGVLDLLEQISKPIWITESGEKGINKQEDYARRIWPFLFGLTPQIRRIYQYQFAEAGDKNDTYGLKNLTPGFTISDLYIYLRDH